jgi:hypothetical protein
LLIVGAPALLRQIAVGPELANRCVDLPTVRAATTGEANKLIELTSDQWQFLRGIYAMNPEAPRFMKPSRQMLDRAMALDHQRKRGGQRG